MHIDFFPIWLAMVSTLLKFMLPVLFLFSLPFGFKKFFALLEKRRLSKSGIEEIDKMSGYAFEKYLEALFERLGYRVERTGRVGDFGSDLITRKNGIKTVIQAKRYFNKVGVRAVQEAVAARGHYGCEEAMVVTNSYFTPPARRLAVSNNVTLWDRKELATAMNSIDFPATSFIGPPPLKPGAVTEINPPQPGGNETTCATCGKPVSEKVKAYCRSNGKRFAGKVYCYEHQRGVGEYPKNQTGSH